MPLACIFSPTEKMRVVTFEERDKLVATGKWFAHPNDILKKELDNEKPIRQRTRKRINDSESSSTTI